jgi:hypothetical protein
MTSTLSESLACNHCHQGTQDSSVKTKGPSDELISSCVDETLFESLTPPYIRISPPSDTMRPILPNLYSDTISCSTLSLHFYLSFIMSRSRSESRLDESDWLDHMQMKAYVDVRNSTVSVKAVRNGELPMFAVVDARRTFNICVRPAGTIDMSHNISVQRREITVQRR